MKEHDAKMNEVVVVVDEDVVINLPDISRSDKGSIRIRNSGSKIVTIVPPEIESLGGES